MTRRTLASAILASSILFATPAHAQVGMRGGVNLARFVGADVASADARAGLNAGGTFPLFRLGPVSLVPELYYAQKGANRFRAEGQVLPVQTTLADYSIDYIEVPMLVRVSVPLTRAGTVSLYFAGGPAYAWNLGCTFRPIDDPAAPADCDQGFHDVETALKAADRGAVVDGGLILMVPGLGGINIDARLVRGLDRIRESAQAGEVKNQAFSVMLGYSLGSRPGPMR